eukprot:GFUD01021189.1.p1 GENE.GFUD01021189.1~~GFUD01021189.1.p1  ORF type:complete len:381 (-),score=106.66 GFUD01021189.1:113-1255(-)
MEEIGRDNGILLDESFDEFNKVAEAVEMKKVKLDELLSSEERYLEDLEKISLIYEEVKKTKEDKNHPISMPPELSEGRDLMVFGNILQITDFHKRIFTKGLRNANNDTDNILELFRKREGDMKIRYGKYCINHPVSDLIVNQFQDSYFNKIDSHLGQEMRLVDQLFKPVQHIMQYDLFFRELVKCCEMAGQEEEAEKFRECSKIVGEINLHANNMMAAGRIDKFYGGITKQGELIHRGPVFCKLPSKRSLFSRSKLAAKLEAAHIFLFQKCVIVCYSSERITEMGPTDEYLFWHQFLINKMQVRDIAGGSKENEFELHDMNKESTTPGLSLTITTTTMEEKRDWVKKINNEIHSLESLKSALGNPKSALGNPRKTSVVQM